MRLNKNLGMVLLAIWLIITGLASLVSFSLAGVNLLMALRTLYSRPLTSEQRLATSDRVSPTCGTTQLSNEPTTQLSNQ